MIKSTVQFIKNNYQVLGVSAGLIGISYGINRAIDISMHPKQIIPIDSYGIEPSNTPLVQKEPQKAKHLTEEWLCKTGLGRRERRLPNKFQVSKQTEISPSEFMGTLYSLPIYGSTVDGDIQRVQGNLHIAERPNYKQHTDFWRNFFSFSEIAFPNTFLTDSSTFNLHNPNMYPIQLAVSINNECSLTDIDPGATVRAQVSSDDTMWVSPYGIGPNDLPSTPSEDSSQRGTNRSPFPWKWPIGILGFSGLGITSWVIKRKSDHEKKLSEEHYKSNTNQETMAFTASSNRNKLQLSPGREFDIEQSNNKFTIKFSDGTKLASVFLFLNKHLTITPTSDDLKERKFIVARKIQAMCNQKVTADKYISQISIQCDKNNFLESKSGFHQRDNGYIITAQQAIHLKHAEEEPLSKPTIDTQNIITLHWEFKKSDLANRNNLRLHDVQILMLTTIIEAIKNSGQNIDSVCLFRPHKKLMQHIKQNMKLEVEEGKAPFERGHWYVRLKQ